MDDIAEHLNAISARIPLRRIKTKRDYKAATAALNALLDSGGADENAPLATLVTLLGDLIGEYEETQSPPDSTSPADTLRFLMDQHRLNQSDLPEIGSQGVVSEILRGKRDLNVRQIKLLAERFNVGVQAFV
ncbi:transcriptional regulator [Tardiphaga alba]|uniref:Transcriptional regulator n=1 Tax=Tardiphaga alba TaxID=340268 RepID=A0ABX8AFN6_9BRAD|nr:transcriptional regulator [Tardiphaga alba]